MKRGLLLTLTALVIIVVAASGFAQDPAAPANGTIVAPPSTLNRAAGLRWRTCDQTRRQCL